MANLLNGLWQGILLTAVVGLLLRLMPRLNAATRYAIWWTAITAVMVLPFRPMLSGESLQLAASPPATPPTTEELPISATSAATVPQATEMSRPDVALVSAEDPEIRLPAPAEFALRQWLPIQVPQRPVSALIALVWAVASSALFVRLAISWRLLQRLKENARPASELLRARMQQLSARAGIRRQTRLLVSDEVTAPMALGLFSPAVLIPRSLCEQLSESNFDHIALHELAHLHRYDDWTNLLQKVFEAMLPVQPAIFWIGRQLMLERETACGDWAIALTGAPKRYAASLTRVAELTLRGACGILASGAGGHPSQLYRRIHRLLDAGRNVVPTIVARPLATAVAVVIVLALGSTRLPQVIALTPSASAAAVKSRSAKAAPDAESRTQTESFAVKPRETLVVDVDRGDVRVTTWKENSVRIVVTRSGPDLEQFLKHHRITMTQEGDRVQVTAKADAALSKRSLRVQVRYRIKVPESFDASLKNGLGDLVVLGLEGEVDATAASGRVRLGNIAGSARAEIGAGDLDVSEMRGPLDATIGTGNLSLDGIDGPVICRSGSGDVKAVDCLGKLSIEVSAGNIDIRNFAGPSVAALIGVGGIAAELTTAPESDCSLKTATGQITVTLGETVSLNLHALATMGNIDADVPIPVDRQLLGGSLQGEINGGGPSLALETSLGDLQILTQ